MAIDLHYANVSLLLHFDGADGSTTLVDGSPRPKTVTAYGDAAITTAEGRFGGACLALSGISGGHVSSPAHADYAFGAGDFTVEMWVKTTRIHGTLVDHPGDVDGQPWWALHYYYGRLAWSDYENVSNLLEGNIEINDGDWHHIAVTRQGNVLRSFVDGAVDGVEYFSPGDDANYAIALDLHIGENLSYPWPQGNFSGQIDEVRITKGVARYTGVFAVPADPFPESADTVGIAAAPSLLGVAQALAKFGGGVEARATAASPLATAKVLAFASTADMVAAQVFAPSPLARPAAVAFHDFTSVLGDAVTLYVMDLVTPTGSVRVPISSWQATLQTGSSCYVQCVIPACTIWRDALNTATEFVISRRAGRPTGAAIEYEMARAPAEQLQYDQGPQRHTCTLSGYSDAFADSADPPPAVYDRALTGVRSISSGKSYRVRCAVDWLLRPGHRAFVSGAPFVVKFINYYAPSEWDSYMDVGG